MVGCFYIYVTLINKNLKLETCLLFPLTSHLPYNIAEASYLLQNGVGMKSYMAVEKGNMQ